MIQSEILSLQETGSVESTFIGGKVFSPIRSLSPPTVWILKKRLVPGCALLISRMIIPFFPDYEQGAGGLMHRQANSNINPISWGDIFIRYLYRFKLLRSHAFSYALMGLRYMSRATHFAYSKNLDSSLPYLSGR